MKATTFRLWASFCWLVLSALSLPVFSQSLQSPDEFFRHQVGEQFTWHHEMVAYYEYVAANSNRVKLWEYGRSIEGRPLLLAAVSSPENLARLEEIQKQHLAGTLPNARAPKEELAIVWLSFGVHGNEAGATESAPPVLYELANPDNQESGAWLRNTVVLIDPCLNPDGNSRYTNWYRSVVGQTPNAAPHAHEHREPWPGGRSNHYQFDLNRDWAWATQPETRQRLTKYHEWLPHIHIDFHEQFIDEPYYFAPAAVPLHRYVSGWQQSFQTEIGLNNAAHFDEQGWLYFTREFFDLLYPSYGDTYPTFNGAIGMTYEQAGHGRAGLAIETANGQTLRLADRIAHHTATALVGVSVASENAAELGKNFRQYYQRAQSEPPGQYHSYIVHREGNSEAQLQALTELLDLHGIEYGRAGQNRSANGFLYHQGVPGSSQVREDDLLISSRQAQGVLVQVLFEPETALEDSLTYDITSWALPFAHGLQAIALEEAWQPKGEFTLNDEAQTAPLPEAYAYLLPWNSIRSARFLAAVQQQDVVVRVAEKAFRTREGQAYEPGTLLITRADNAGQERLTQILERAALESGVRLQSQRTGFSTTGPDLGSPSMRLLQRPNILLLRGDGVQDNSFGYAWHYFEQVLHYPVTLVDIKDLSRVPLDDYNLLVLPEGSYRLEEELGETLNSWVQEGGRVLATGQALGSLRQWAGSGLQLVEAPSPKPPASYAERERHFLPDYTAGATVQVRLDASHPLAYGLGDTYFSLKTNNQAYKPLEQGWNVGTIGSELVHFGFIGQRLQERQLNSLQLGVESKGAGNLIYLVDDPLYRGFWQRGQLLYANAVFFTGQ